MEIINKILATVLAIAAFMPIAVSAQEANADLRSTIQNSVLADPRVANVPPAQLQELVDALFAQAQAQHMTSADILWRPQQAAAGSTFGNNQGAETTTCTSGWQGYLCNFNHIFGFEGNNYTIPVFLLVTTAFLIAVIWELIIHHRKKMAKMAAAATPAPASVPPSVQ